MNYAVVFEKTATGYSAYVPDLSGCVAAGTTMEETEQLIREAVELHLDAMRADGDPIPEPTTVVSTVTVEPAA
jgi:predicted RNase H-like HicB family nuclease